MRLGLIEVPSDQAGLYSILPLTLLLVLKRCYGIAETQG